MSRRQLATRLGVSGAVLGLIAGLIQALAGYAIPEWTGNKLAHGSLGLLTVGLSTLAGLAALRQRDPQLSLLSRAACSVGLIGPGLLCLTTVGRLWYLPAVLLTAAGLLTVVRWRATVLAVLDDWDRVLLSVLGGCELFMVASGPAVLTIAGGLGGAVLIVAAWWRPASRRTVAGLVVLGTVPFAALAWTAVVPVLLAVLAGLLTLPLVRTGRRTDCHVRAKARSAWVGP
jgi:hypothetical protein